MCPVFSCLPCRFCQLCTRFGAGASSGLHHDYHDNLYILLRGRKRFRLYPPSEARNMYTHGQVQHVHPNGRIVYKDQVQSAAFFAKLVTLSQCVLPGQVWFAGFFAKSLTLSCCILPIESHITL